MITRVARRALARRSHLATAEAGLSLIELMISLVIIGIGVVGIVGVIGSAHSGTLRARHAADIGQLTTRIADAVQNAGWECSGTPYSLLLDAEEPPGGWAIETVDVKHWGQSRTFEAGCPAVGAHPVFRTLMLTVRITSPQSIAVRQFTMVKRP